MVLSLIQNVVQVFSQLKSNKILINALILYILSGGLQAHLDSVVIQFLLFFFQQWNQLSRFQRNICYFAVISLIILIIYLLPGKTQVNTAVDESDYDSAKVVQEHPKLHKVI